MPQSTITLAGGQELPLLSWRAVQYWPAVGVYVLIASIYTLIALAMFAVGSIRRFITAGPRV